MQEEEKKQEGDHMEPTGSGPERFVDPSERIVLKCAGCAERLILLGLEEDWYREGRTSFPCGGCGREVTLANRVEEGDPFLEDLVRRVRISYLRDR